MLGIIPWNSQAISSKRTLFTYHSFMYNIFYRKIIILFIFFRKFYKFFNYFVLQSLVKLFFSISNLLLQKNVYNSILYKKKNLKFLLFLFIKYNLLHSFFNDLWTSSSLTQGLFQFLIFLFFKFRIFCHNFIFCLNHRKK